MGKRSCFSCFIQQEEEKKNNFDIIFLLFCIAGGVVSLFLMINYTGFWRDEIYQALCVRRYQEAPLGLLSFYIGHCWTEIFGFSLLNLRILASLCSLFAVAITSVYAYRLTENLKLTGVSFLLGCILMRVAAFYLYNWDVGIYVFDALALCLLISVISKPSTLKYLLLGAVTALITLGRLPSVVILPLTVLLVVFANRYNKSLFNPVKASVMIITGWVLFVFIGIVVIMGSPVNYFSSITEGNIVSGHSPLSDFKTLFYRLTFISYFTSIKWFPGIGCIFLAIICPKIKKSWIAIIFVILWVIYGLLFVTQKFIEDSAFPMIIGGDTIIGLGLLLAYPVYRLFQPGPIDKIFCLKLWAFFILMVSMAFGSDAYTERMITGFMVPLLVALLWQLNIASLRIYSIYLLGISLLVFASMCSFNFFYLKRKYDAYNVPVQTIWPYQNVRTSFWNEDEIRKLKTAIPFLQEREIKYAAIGEHLALELAYGPDNGLSFHQFHEDLYDKNDWLKNRDVVLARVDAVVYPLDIPYIDYDVILKDLKDAGFTNSLKMGEAVILSRKPLMKTRR